MYERAVAHCWPVFEDHFDDEIEIRILLSKLEGKEKVKLNLQQTRAFNKFKLDKTEAFYKNLLSAPDGFKQRVRCLQVAKRFHLELNKAFRSQTRSHRFNLGSPMIKMHLKKI